MAVRIILDSTADVRKELKESFPVVPLTVHFSEEEYIDGVTITHDEFYKKLTTGDVLPSTSQATPDAFDRMFAQVTRDGDTAVVLTISSHLSGTYQSAMIAAEEYENIYVVDTESATIGAGILAELALTLAREGLDAAAIAARLETEKKNIRILALVDTLEYLKRGGRISKAVAFAGGILNIKPLISVIGGEIQMIGKARGTKQGNSLLVAELEKAGGADFTRPVLLGYTGLSGTLMENFIADSRQQWAAGVSTLNTTQIGSVIGTHAGPGAFAVAFFTKGSHE